MYAKLIITLTLLCFYSISALPSFPTIKDEIFPAFDTGVEIPRIKLTFVYGVPTLPFSIGNPRQKFTGIFDTSSPITWVMSDKCNSSACLSVPDSEKFHAKASSTNFQFPLSVDMNYLDGSHVQLKPELDAITFADKFTIPRHLIGEAYKVDYPKGYVAPADARLGMGGFGSIDWTKMRMNLDLAPITNPFSGVFKRAAGDDVVSTGYIKSGSSDYRKRFNFNEISSSAFILGVDKTLYSDPVYKLPLVPLQGFNSPFWKIPIAGLQLKYTNITQQFKFSSGGHGKIDSSSPIITLPRSTADAINTALGATFNAQLNMYTIDCEAMTTGPWFVIQFAAGVNAHIPADQFIYQQNDGSSCYTAIGGGTDEQNIYLGGPFFRSFYLMYHYTGLSVNIAESSVVQAGKLFAQ
ncbi:aspartic peptidase domain-containing protein [Helicostylum pulchrum]|nr:aspartic peptidase domain-containing protein [Helicostylum pulchrum]